MTEKKPRSKKPALDMSTTIYGKVPPQAIEIEDAILGICMITQNTFEIVADILKPEAFYRESNQRIFRAMQTLSGSGITIDFLSVVNELKRTEELDLVGGPYAITKLSDKVTNSSGLEHYCLVVLRTFMKRELIRIGGEIVGQAYEDSSDVYELLDEHEKSLTAITTGHVERQYTQIDAELVQRYNRIQELRRKESHITGIPSGYRDVDTLTHGWQPTDLIILAARPSVGKTAFALTLARNATRDGHPVGFFSLEMSKGQLMDRLLSAEAEIELGKVRNGNLTDDENHQLYEFGMKPLSTAKILIDDTAALNVYSLRRKARSMKRKHGIKLIILDYLQLMSGDNPKNREQEISKISRELKGLAKELEIPIIALSQLSRKLEERKAERQMPQLSDLRESGAIEQDADTVMFLFRPEYHDQNHNAMGESTKGKTLLSFAKHRNGCIAMGNDAIKLRAELQYQRFYTVDPETEGQLEQQPSSGFRPIKLDKPARSKQTELIPDNDDQPF